MLYHLNNLLALSIKGPQARTFLQGQLTADLNQVSNTHKVSAALCNAKGRVIALLDVLCWNGQFLLIYPADLHPHIHKELALAARLSRVSLEPLTSLTFFGLYNPEPAWSAFLPASPLTCHGGVDWLTYQVCDALFIGVSTPQGLTELPFVQSDASLNDTRWHQHLVAHQRMRIYPETSGHFLPNRLTLEALGYVSLQKGCYKGQEIIARLHYRSQQRYALKTLTMPATTTLKPGDPYRDPTTQQLIGEVIDRAPLDALQATLLLSIRQL